MGMCAAVGVRGFEDARPCHGRMSVTATSEPLGATRETARMSAVRLGIQAHGSRVCNVHKSSEEKIPQISTEWSRRWEGARGRGASTRFAGSEGL